MREIGAFQAKNKLGQLLDWVEAGEEIVITRRGKAVAKLVSARPALDRQQAERAAAAIPAMSRGARLGGLRLKDLVAEGRR